MSINKIQLPPQVIADLYRHSLIAAESREAALDLEPGEPKQYKFLGKHLKRTSFILSAPDSFSIPEKHLAFLVKILEACKMTLADVAILNHASHPVEIHALREQINPRNMILFGIEPKEIGLPFNSPAFKIQEYDQCTYLYAPSMEALNQDTDEGKLLKSKLWVCLRKMFEV